MTLLEKIKINIDYLLGKADPSLYTPPPRERNISLKEWQRRWENFSYQGNGFIWYGVDQDDNLAEFGSDEAYVPEAFFENVATNKILTEFFENLPEVTVSLIPETLRPELKNLAIKAQGEKNFWKIGANRGLFIFEEPEISEFRDVNGKSSYELSLIPEEPLKIKNLPKDIQDLLKPYHFENLRFADCQFLDVSKYLYCEV